MTAFTVRPWAEIVAFYDDLEFHGVTFVEPMKALAESIIFEGRATQIVGHTSMHDLVVTTARVSERPDWLWVSAPTNGRVRVEHQKPTGPGDAIERDVDELLPLFWRFSIEKWGIHPARDAAMGGRHSDNE